MAHACNPSTWKAEASVSYKPVPGRVKLYLKTETNKQKPKILNMLLNGSRMKQYFCKNEKISKLFRHLINLPECYTK